jgi:HEPN domain-containing protein
MQNNEFVLEWFSRADSDLFSAQFLLNMRPIPVEIICYHCQQCAEKYLKGYLLSQNEEITKTHDLLILNKKCKVYDDQFTNLDGACLSMADYGTNIRYPYPIELNDADAKAAISAAQEIKRFVLKKMVKR